jgi:hypothetical protein
MASSLTKVIQNARKKHTATVFFLHVGFYAVMSLFLKAFFTVYFHVGVG